MREDSVRLLRQVGESDGARVELGEAALALAALHRDEVDLDRYRHHLGMVARDVAAIAQRLPDDLGARLTALNEVIVGKYGYRGDSESYEDLQNANMLTVIDRRRGLPVTLGILYIAAARAQGWDCVGLAFPGHFLVRLEAGPERAIVDPFNEGVTPDAAALRRLLQATHGDGIDLQPDHYAPVSDRSILLRLQNNLKLRLIGTDRIPEALATIENMMLFAPGELDLWREAAMLHAHQGNLNHATRAIEHYLAHATDERQRHRMAALLQRLRLRLH